MNIFLKLHIPTPVFHPRYYIIQHMRLVLVALKHTIIFHLSTFFLSIAFYNECIHEYLFTYVFSFQLLTVDVKSNVIQFKCVLTGIFQLH